MAALLRWYSINKKRLHPIILAAYFHTEFERIHPFVDGNKRSGAYSFVWFLRQERILDITRLTPSALTALTILVAESSPKDKDKMIGLIVTLLLGPSTPTNVQ